MNQTTTPVLAGRELDALIAERVMGWKRVQAPKWDYHGPLPEQGEVLVPPDLISAINSGEYVWPPSGVIPFDFFVSQRYSTDIAAAWEVVTHLLRQDYRIELFSPGHQAEGEIYWTCCFVRGGFTQGWARETTECLAICRAALAAIAVRNV